MLHLTQQHRPLLCQFFVVIPDASVAIPHVPVVLRGNVHMSETTVMPVQEGMTRWVIASGAKSAGNSLLAACRDTLMPMWPGGLQPFHKGMMCWGIVAVVKSA